MAPPQWGHSVWVASGWLIFAGWVDGFLLWRIFDKGDVVAMAGKLVPFEVFAEDVHDEITASAVLGFGAGVDLGDEI